MWQFLLGLKHDGVILMQVTSSTKSLLLSPVQTLISFCAAKPMWSTDDRQSLAALMCHRQQLSMFRDCLHGTVQTGPTLSEERSLKDRMVSFSYEIPLTRTCLAIISIHLSYLEARYFHHFNLRNTACSILRVQTHKLHGLHYKKKSLATKTPRHEGEIHFK